MASDEIVQAAFETMCIAHMETSSYGLAAERVLAAVEPLIRADQDRKTREQVAEDIEAGDLPNFFTVSLNQAWRNATINAARIAREGR